MRVLFCKIHCSSFLCFRKPSTASHIHNSSPLKLEISPHAPHPSDVTGPCDQNHVEESVEIKENESLDNGKQESEIEIVAFKSCMKNNDDSQSRSPIARKKVQWVDNLGKQLVDIKEFESSETGDAGHEDDSNACFCAIL